MITGDQLPRHIVINTPSRDYGIAPKCDNERELTPYGAASVATYGRHALRQRGVGDGVGFIDAENFGLSLSCIVDEVFKANDGKGTVGINVLTPNFVTTMQLAQALNKAMPNLRLVFGGPHATLDPTSILRYVADGIVVVGDGEIPFFRIINGESIDEIDGLVFQRSSGAITKIGKRSASVLTDLDLLPWLDRALLANEPFLKDGMRTMTFLGSRGCVGNCSFCITPAQYTVMKGGGAKRMRFRSMEDVVREVVSLSDKFEVAQFIDDDMLPSSSRVRSFLQLWSKYGLAGTKDFVCLLRPDQIATYGANGLLDELHSAGLKKISLGIETGHDRGRHMVSANATGIDKKYRPETQITAIQQCARVGIETKGFFMIGLPGETRAEIAQTLAFMRHLGDNGLSKAAIFPVKVYPNTQLWDHAVSLGFTAEQLGHYDAPDVQALIRSGMDAKDASRDGFVQQIQLSEIPIGELNDVCQHAMQEFKKEGLK